MTSQEAIEVARRFFDAMNRQDYEAAMDLGHPDLEIQDHPGVDAASWHFGREGSWQWGFKLNEAFRDFRFTADEFVPLEADDHVIVVGTVSGMGRLSGVPVDAPFAAVVTVKDGLGKRVAIYREKREALEAAGLSE